MRIKNQNKPGIRFNSFTDDWEQRKLREIFAYRQGQQVPIEEQYFVKEENMKRFIRIVDLTMINEPERYILYSGENIVEKDDLFMIRYGNPGIVGHGYTGVIANNLFRLIPKIETNNTFYKYSLEILYPQIKNISSSSTMPALNFRSMDNLVIKITSIKEQKQIGLFFRELDNLITLHQRKLDKFNELKKAMLSKMFPKTGEDVPELRFPGFTNAWEQRKLGDIGEFGKRYSYSRADEGKGEYAHVHYGDIHSTYNSFIRRETKVPTIKLELEHEVLCNGDIIIADASEDHDDLGKTLVIEDVDDRKLIAGLHTFNFRPSKILNSKFYLYYTQSSSYKNFVYKKATGISVLGLSKRNIEKMVFKLPNNEEQEQIGSFFRELDNIITLHQRKVENLELMKRYLLKNMFI